MRAANIDTTTFTLLKQGSSTPVGAAVTYDAQAKKATLNPDAGLDAGATYTATIKGGTGGVKDAAGNALANDKLWSFTTTSTASVAKINFQPQNSTLPQGYTKDFGQAYDAARGFGWVKPGTSEPIDMTPNTRERTSPTDPRLRTLIHMQGNGTVNRPNTGSWEYSVPNGTYDVTLSVGDADFFDGTDGINVEGQTIIPVFQRSLSEKHRTGSGTVTVNDGRLSVVATGTNTKLNYIDISQAAQGNPDTVAPTVTTTVPAAGSSNVPISANVEATFSEDMRAANIDTTTFTLLKQGSSTPVGAAVTYDAQAKKATLNPDAGLDAGATYTATIKGGTGGVKDAAGNALANDKTWSFTSASAPSNAEIEVENRDGVPFPDRIAFSRIQNPEDGTRLTPNGQCCVPVNYVHDTATLRVKNTGSDPLEINGLSLTGPWQLVDQINLPTTVATGGQLDVQVRFVAQFAGTQNGLHNGTLTVESNDADESQKSVELSGFWQSVSEGGQEPTLTDIAKVFGYKTKIVGSGQAINGSGRIQAVGDEVISPYWQRADATKSVTARQLAAYHSQGNTATLSWTNKGSTSSTAVLTHKGTDGQTVLPRKSDSQAIAQASFAPSATVFGFRIDAEYSDPTLNNRQVDYNNNCPLPAPGELETCGHHVRFWPVRDQSGTVIPDTYLMTMDYAGVNYDYNDNVYLLENIKPEPQALYRLDVASPATTYRDTAFDYWTPDNGLYTPDTAIAEGANVQPQGIANTNDDVIYRTYRGNVGDVPLDQRALTYNLPTKGLQKMDVKLHFAERYWQASGQRVFDIEAEGQLLQDDYDIYAAAGGENTATTLRFNDVQVTDGELTLVFRAEADYPSVAAIEVLCGGLCPPSV